MDFIEDFYKIFYNLFYLHDEAVNMIKLSTSWFVYLYKLF